MAASERSEIGRRVDPSMASANQEAVFRCWTGQVSSYLHAKDMAMWTSASKLLYGARATVRVFEGVRCNRQNVDSLILFVNTLVGLRVLDLKGLEILENLYISQIKISGFGFVLWILLEHGWSINTLIHVIHYMWNTELEKLSNYWDQQTSLWAITTIFVDKCHDCRHRVREGICTIFIRWYVWTTGLLVTYVFDNPTTGNDIGAEGAKHLNLPANLQTLDLGL